MHTRPTQSKPRRIGGFSLIEVLIAMGIFAVGFIAVAAMFPAAIILQRQTVTDVESQLVARNAKAIVRAKLLTFRPNGQGADLGERTGEFGSTNIGWLSPLWDLAKRGTRGNTLDTRWSLSDRSYPSFIDDADDRRYYWVPLLRNGGLAPAKADGTPAQVAKGSGDFTVVVFVLKREQGVDYNIQNLGAYGTNPVIANPPDDHNNENVPKVIGIDVGVSGARFLFDNDFNNDTIPDLVLPGHSIADNHGVTYFVSDASTTGCTIVGGIPLTDPNLGSPKMWFAPPPRPGEASPATRVLLLSGVVESLEN